MFKNMDKSKTFAKTLKKERNDFENISGTGQKNVKAVLDRALKTVGIVEKTVHELLKQRREQERLNQAHDDIEARIAKNL